MSTTGRGEAALREQWPVPADVVGKAPKGVRVRVYGLNGLLPFGRIRGIKRTTPPTVVETKVQRLLGEQPEVDVLQLDADRGTIIVSEHVSPARQLRLPPS